MLYNGAMLFEPLRNRGLPARLNWRALGIVTGALCAFALCACPALADEAADWNAVHATEKKLEAQKSDAANTIATYTQFLHEVKPGPEVSCLVYSRIADAQRAQKQWEPAIATCENALQKYGKEAAGAVVLLPLARALRESGKSAEAAALAGEEWPLLVSAARSNHNLLITHTSLALQEIVAAQSDLANDAKLAPIDKEKMLAARQELLQRALIEMPVFLDDRQQGAGGYFQGWMEEALIEALSARGETGKKAAPGWARLYWMTCAFDAKAIERAARVLAKAWAVADDFAAIRAFARAQDEPQAGDNLSANPLHLIKATIPSPEIGQLLSQRLTDLTSRPGFERSRAIETIDLQLVSAALAAGGQVDAGKPVRTREEKAALLSAMQHATKLMAERPEDAAGMEQICRIFKAADGSTRRANAFLAHLDGRGENPLPAFLNEMQ